MQKWLLLKCCGILPLPDAEEETSAAKEPQASQETHQGKRCSGPQKSLEEIGCSARGI